MKTHCLIIVAILYGTISFPAQPKLVADIYPSAVEVAFWNEDIELKRTEGFYTKDEIAEVRSYYERKYGSMENDYLHGRTLDEKKGKCPFVYSGAILSLQEVRKQVSILPEPAGVELQALDPKHRASSAPESYRAVGKYFEGVRQSVMIGEAEQEEFEEVVRRFKHLAWSYYQKVEEMDESGKRLTMDEIIYRRCEDRQQQGMSDEELAAELQKLYMAGKFDEAEKLSERAGGYGNWDHWISCLEELEEHAYKTLIIIHKNPSSWEE